MSKKNNKAAAQAVSKTASSKTEVFDTKSDAGAFQKGRADPGIRTDVKGKSHKTGTKDNYANKKAACETHELVNEGTNKLVESAEEMSIQADQEFFRKHEEDDDKDTENVSRREEMRVRRKHRKRDTRKRIKEEFIQSEGNFQTNSELSEELKPDGERIGRLDKMKSKEEKANTKTQKARSKLKQKKEYKLVRHFNEKTGETTYELQVNKVMRKAKKDNPVTAVSRKAMQEAQGFVHGKISQNEKENSGIEAAHKTEEAAENVIAEVGHIKRSVYVRRRNKVAVLEKKQFKAELNFRYQEYLEKHPEMNGKPFKKMIQKQRIKREYAKAVRKGTQAKQAAGYAQKAANKTTDMARKIAEFAAKHKGAIVVIGLLGLFFMLIMGGLSSCAAMFGGGMSTTMAGSYQSEPAELDACDLALAEKEVVLQNTIDRIETDHPGYDEYNYNLDEIGHDPFTLINYLSAVHVEVVASYVDSEIESLFNDMYTLTLTPRTETRTRTVTKTRTVTDPVTGQQKKEEYEDEEEYTVTILDVELTRKPLEDVVAERLAGNADAEALYDVYKDTHGALQQFYTPLDMDWYSMISSYYGYRKNPFTGETQFHRGIDIAVPEGTEVYAAQDGTVITAEYDDSYGNYIVIEDDRGHVTKYAHLQSMNVSAGQTVKHGTVIGKTGNTGASTGSHLHLECMAGGEYYNPLFYFSNGNGSLYGTTDALGASGDAEVLINEAERYLGYPYVWGGSDPSTSFDCSGFVCYALKNSGYYDTPRTTAQGLYNMCEHIDPSEARAGDLIFFTGTYSSGNPVTHVGIYAGDGQMIHCGDPIKYSSIYTPYWQNHFFGFGRLSLSDGSG